MLLLGSSYYISSFITIGKVVTNKIWRLYSRFGYCLTNKYYFDLYQIISDELKTKLK